MKRLIAFVLILVFMSMAPLAMAEGLEDLFREGNKAFEKGEYETAVNRYRELERLGVNSSVLFYNRATAEARLGNLGMAVLYYNKVLLRNPKDEDTLHNIQVVRDFIARRANEQGRDADLSPAAGPWRATLDRFSPVSASVSFLVFFVLLFALLFSRRFVKGELSRLSLGVASGVMTIVACALLAITIGKRHQIVNMNEAIIVEIDNEQLGVYEGPGSKVLRFGLEEGARVRVLERRRDWVKIEDDQGRNGWTESDSVKEI